MKEGALENSRKLWGSKRVRGKFARKIMGCPFSAWKKLVFPSTPEVAFPAVRKEDRIVVNHFFESKGMITCCLLQRNAKEWVHWWNKDSRGLAEGQCSLAGWSLLPLPAPARSIPRDGQVQGGTPGGGNSNTRSASPSIGWIRADRAKRRAPNFTTWILTLLAKFTIWNTSCSNSIVGSHKIQARTALLCIWHIASPRDKFFLSSIMEYIHSDTVYSYV